MINYSVLMEHFIVNGAALMVADYDRLHVLQVISHDVTQVTVAACGHSLDKVQQKKIKKCNHDHPKGGSGSNKIL